MLEQLYIATSLTPWDACGLRKISRFRLISEHFHFQLVEDCFSVAIDNQSDSTSWIYLGSPVRAPTLLLNLRYLIQYFPHEQGQRWPSSCWFPAWQPLLPREKGTWVLVHKWAEGMSLLTVKFCKIYMLGSGVCLSTLLIISLIAKWFCK